MKRLFSSLWKSSTKTSKQRKYRAKAPLHVKNKFLHVHLSAELNKKHGKRNTRVRVGDKVKIVKGDYKKHEGKVERVDVRNTRIFVEGISAAKKDGTKNPKWVRPAQVEIVELQLEDKRRQKALERK